MRREPAQLYMYQKITEMDPRLKEKIAETYGTRVSSVKIRELLYYHVPTNKEYSFERAGDKEIGSFWERVLGVADSIRGLKFEPSPGTVGNISAVIVSSPRLFLLPPARFTENLA